jgi:hypothetical protein
MARSLDKTTRGLLYTVTTVHRFNCTMAFHQLTKQIMLDPSISIIFCVDNRNRYVQTS